MNLSQTKVLGLIPARGGSESIIKKNIRNLFGVPLIGYILQSSSHSHGLTRTIVSTDCEEIAEIARSLGADVPFIRPSELAQDESLTIDVMSHALKWMLSRGTSYDYVCLLQPTCPLTKTRDIDQAIKMGIEKRADTVISVTAVKKYHPLTYYEGNPSYNIRPLVQMQERGCRRQDFPDIWWRNGSIYLVKSDLILKENKIYGDHILGYVMEDDLSLNIDDESDWKMAEIVMRMPKLVSS